MGDVLGQALLQTHALGGKPWSESCFLSYVTSVKVCLLKEASAILSSTFQSVL